MRAAELIAGFKLKSTDEGSRERRAFQKIVHRCLVGPFDRAYLDCLDGPERQRLCLAEYRRRAELRSTGKGD